jgi:histidine triad (HIT) family protein
VELAPVEASSDCDFCAIARGDNQDVEIVCEADDWVAFFPLRPATVGHTLVIPRQHVADLWDADPHLGGELMKAAIEVGRAIRSALTPAGMNLITSSGAEAEQTVYHLHLHVVPRYPDDALDQIWPPKRDLPGVDLKGVADRIREVWRAPR